MSASSGTTLISPPSGANGPANGGDGSGQTSQPTTPNHPPNPQRKHSRTSSHAHAAGHGHGHAHAVHHAAHGPRRHNSSSSHSSRLPRRGSDGESGRRALAAGLTMHVLEPAPPKQKRKTSEPHVHGHHAHTSHTHARLAHHAGPKASRSDTHLPALSRQGSTSSVSALSSASGVPPKHRGSNAEVQVEVIAGTAGQDDGDGEWVSGEETPAGTSRRATPGQNRGRINSTGRSESLKRSSGKRPAAKNRESTADSSRISQVAGSPLDLATPSPGHEPRETRRVEGFPGPGSALQTPEPSNTSSQPTSRPASRPPSRLALSRPGSHTSLPTSHERDRNSSSRERNSSSTVAKAGGQTGDPVPHGTEPGFPFPRMLSDTGRADTPSDAPSSVSTGTETTAPQRKAAPLPAPLCRPPSHSSLRSIQSLRAPPHPLNATGHLDSPKANRAASLHYPPAAPAVVYRETVEGHGWDGENPPPHSAPPQQQHHPRPERVGSFSSVRSLKDILGPTRRSLPTQAPRRPAGQLAQPRRLTAMQAASAIANLKTTTDPVAYHQSLGFSPATAETAHLLSRFLPSKRKPRPRWAITAREALAAHEAVAAGEAPEDHGRIGLTDGQYRDAHESLVASLQALSQPSHSRRVPRSYSYHSLLGATEDLSLNSSPPRREGAGKTPFELSAARCLLQRPRVPY